MVVSRIDPIAAKSAVLVLMVHVRVAASTLTEFIAVGISVPAPVQVTVVCAFASETEMGPMRIANWLNNIVASNATAPVKDFILVPVTPSALRTMICVLIFQSCWIES